MTRKTVKLVAPDRNGVLCYQGDCKLTIDSKFSKTLKVEPKNKDFPDISAFYRWKFIQKMNLMFVFADNKIQDFVLIFANDEICTKVHDAIYKNREKDSVEKEELEQRLLLPIFQIISQQYCSRRLKRVMLAWIEKHEENEKRELLKLLKKQKRNHQIIDVKNIKPETNIINVGKRRFSEMENNGMNNGSLNNIKCEENHPKRKKFDFSDVKILDESKFKIANIKYRNGIHRKLLIFTSSDKTQCYEYNFYSKENYFYHKCCRNAEEIKAILKTDKNGNECVEFEDKKHACTSIKFNPEKYIELQIVRKPNYEISENCLTRTRRMLIIFDSNDRSQCYEYFWSSKREKYQCCGCVLKNKYIFAEVCHENTENEYVRLLNNEHICEMRKFNSEKYAEINKYVLSPNFEIQTKIKNGKERKNLIIFPKNDRQSFYSYYHNYRNMYYCSPCAQQRKNVFARICQNDDGEEYVILSTVKHVCSLKESNPQKEIILRPPNIKFMESTENYTSKLILFDSNDNQLCYIFSKGSQENSKRYRCLGCKKFAKNEKEMTSIKKSEGKGVVCIFLYTDDGPNDEYYVKMMDGQKHLCEPQKYEPEKYEIKILKPKNDYILYRRKEKCIGSVSLAIFDPKNKNLCYKYWYNKTNKHFRCWMCEKKGSATNAKIHQDSDGNEYIIPNKNKHVCKPTQISSIKVQNIVILERSGLTFNESKKEIDEKRIVRLPNFKLLKNKYGIPERRLIVFKNDNKELCYEYRYDSNKFRCNKCRISANLHNDTENGEKYIILSESEHKCEPLKYDIIKTIIDASDFTVFNRNDESKTTKLVIFTNSTKDMCYEYSFLQDTKCFRCCGCYSSKKTVSAKLVSNENEEEYIQLLTTEHYCKPKKFILEEFQPKIVPESGFKLCSNSNGKSNSKLLIFDCEKEDFCYEYNYDSENRSNLFHCNSCKSKKKRVTAKLYEKENGEKYLELSVEKHVCKSKKYDPLRSHKNENAFGDFIVQHNISGDSNSRITVFDGNDKSLGYQYSLRNATNAYQCCECSKKQKFISIRLKIDENGEQYIEFGKLQHLCSIQNFKKKNLIFDDFKFEENGNILITNHPNQEKKCYRFKYDDKISAFCCIKCKEKKKIITATVCNGNDGKEFILLNDVHCCTALSK